MTKRLSQIKKSYIFIISVHCPTQCQMPPVLNSTFNFRILIPKVYIHTWNKNNITVRIPIQECKLYKFGIGQTSPSSLGFLQGARLCESNTALSATIEEKIKLLIGIILDPLHSRPEKLKKSRPKNSWNQINNFFREIAFLAVF